MIDSIHVFGDSGKEAANVVPCYGIKSVVLVPLRSSLFPRGYNVLLDQNGAVFVFIHDGMRTALCYSTQRGSIQRLSIKTASSSCECDVVTSISLEGGSMNVTLCSCGGAPGNYVYFDTERLDFVQTVHDPRGSLVPLSSWPATSAETSKFMISLLYNSGPSEAFNTVRYVIYTKEAGNIVHGVSFLFPGTQKYYLVLLKVPVYLCAMELLVAMFSTLHCAPVHASSVLNTVSVVYFNNYVIRIHNTEIEQNRLAAQAYTALKYPNKILTLISDVLCESRIVISHDEYVWAAILFLILSLKPLRWCFYLYSNVGKSHTELYDLPMPYIAGGTVGCNDVVRYPRSSGNLLSGFKSKLNGCCGFCALKDVRELISTILNPIASYIKILEVENNASEESMLTRKTKQSGSKKKLIKQAIISKYKGGEKKHDSSRLAVDKEIRDLGVKESASVLPGSKGIGFDRVSFLETQSSSRSKFYLYLFSTQLFIEYLETMCSVKQNLRMGRPLLIDNHSISLATGRGNPTEDYVMLSSELPNSKSDSTSADKTKKKEIKENLIFKTLQSETNYESFIPYTKCSKRLIKEEPFSFTESYSSTVILFSYSRSSLTTFSEISVLNCLRPFLKLIKKNLTMESRSLILKMASRCTTLEHFKILLDFYVEEEIPSILTSLCLVMNSEEKKTKAAPLKKEDNAETMDAASTKQKSLLSDKEIKINTSVLSSTTPIAVDDPKNVYYSKDTVHFYCKCTCNLFYDCRCVVTCEVLECVNCGNKLRPKLLFKKKEIPLINVYEVEAVIRYLFCKDENVNVLTEMRSNYLDYYVNSLFYLKHPELIEGSLVSQL